MDLHLENLVVGHIRKNCTSWWRLEHLALPSPQKRKRQINIIFTFVFGILHYFIHLFLYFPTTWTCNLLASACVAVVLRLHGHFQLSGKGVQFEFNTIVRLDISRHKLIYISKRLWRPFILLGFLSSKRDLVPPKEKETSHRRAWC